MIINANKPLCYPRRRYQTMDTANVAAWGISKRSGQQCTPEHCQHCNGWHLKKW